MNTTPSKGSSLSIAAEDGVLAVMVPQAATSASQIFATLFIIVLMGGWGPGFYSALQQVLSGKGGPFLLFWLTAWTIGGGFALRFLFLQLRPALPARLILKPEGLSYDSGRAHPIVDRRTNMFKTDAFKRRRELFAPAELRSLSLRETDSGNRLTVNRGAECIDLAPGATEVDRQWLYGLLRERYRL